MSGKDYRCRKRFFLRFLKENGVYSAYKRYISSPKTYNQFQKTTVNWTFDKCAKKHGMINMVSMLITWHRTKEGYDFWQNLHCKFRSMYEEEFYNDAKL